MQTQHKSTVCNFNKQKESRDQQEQKDLQLWTSEQITQACKGQASQSFNVNGISIDSRTLKPNDLFVALKGPINDGHAHIKSAFLNGAGGVIVDSYENLLDTNHQNIIFVKNTEEALINLATAARQRFQGKVIGITGSFGKTSLKDAIAFLLRGHNLSVTATERSFNNHWGVPLTLSRLYDHHQFGVFEMGMNNAQELSKLSHLVKPNIAVINNVGCMHKKNFSDLEAIALAKAEIFDSMLKDGIAILNMDFGPYKLLEHNAKNKYLNIISFSCHNDQADFYLQEVEIEQNHQILTVKTPQGILVIKLSIMAEVWQANTLALLAILHSCNLDLINFVDLFNQLKQSAGRGQIHSISTLGGPMTVIDESYNAGPDSMKAALRTLSQFSNNNLSNSSGRRIAILGDMLELGDEEHIIHANLAHEIKNLKIDKVYCCGSLMSNLYQNLSANIRGGYALTPQDLIPQVMSNLQSDDIIMVKGSRGQRAYDGRMAYIVNQLLQLDQSGMDYK